MWCTEYAAVVPFSRTFRVLASDGVSLTLSMVLRELLCSPQVSGEWTEAIRWGSSLKENHILSYLKSRRNGSNESGVNKSPLLQDGFLCVDFKFSMMSSVKNGDEPLVLPRALAGTERSWASVCAPPGSVLREGFLLISQGNSGVLGLDKYV